MARNRRGRNKGKGIEVDLSGVESKSFKPIPEGKHTVEITDVEVKDGSAAQYLNITFENEKGKKVWHNVTLASHALFTLKALLTAVGYDIPDGKFDIDPDSLVGLECEVEIAHEIYEGKQKANIIEFIDPEDSEGSGSDEDVEALLEDLDKTDLKEIAKELGTKATALKKLKSEDDLIDHILDEYDEEDILDAYDEVIEEEDSDDDEPDYDDMTLKELKAEAKERGLRIKRGMTEDDIIEMLEEDDE